jgi:Tol biopolymer transport system component
VIAAVRRIPARDSQLLLDRRHTDRCAASASGSAAPLDVGATPPGVHGGAAGGAPTTPAGHQNLVPADEGCVTEVPQVYRFDRQTGRTECVSRTAAGAPGDGPSGDPVVSADGRFVAYPTLAQNLALDCANEVQQIVHTDMDTRATVCVSRGAAGPSSAASRQPTISGDGTLVAFVTPSADLDPACATGEDQVHLRNVMTGTTRCMTVDALGQAGTGPSVEPRLSGDGTQPVYATQATNLVFPGAVLLAQAPGGRATDGGAPLTQREPLAQVMRQSTQVAGAVAELMSRGPGGALGNGASRRPVVSDDGQTVAFDSTATNLSSECATGVAQVLVAGPGGMQCASRNEAGAPGDAPSTAPAISGTGTLVVWVSLAQNLTRAAPGAPDLSQILRRGLAQNAVVEPGRRGGR